MRELIRTGDVAAGVDIGIEGLQVFVGPDGARAGQVDAELFQAVARGVRNPPDRAQQLVEGNADLFPAVLAREQLLAALAQNARRLMVEIGRASCRERV